MPLPRNLIEKTTSGAFDILFSDIFEIIFLKSCYIIITIGSLFLFVMLKFYLFVFSSLREDSLNHQIFF